MIAQLQLINIIIIIIIINYRIKHEHNHFKIMNPFTALKNPSPLHFTSLYFHLSYQPFTSLYFAIHIYNSLPLTSLPFTFYRLHFPSPVFTFLTLVLKICVLPREVPSAPSGSWFQSVMDIFTNVNVSN